MAPAVNEVFQSGSTITVVWDPSVASGDVHISYEGMCVSRFTGNQIWFARGYTVSDVGMHTANINDILNSFQDQSDFNTNINCPGTVTVERNSRGSIDPNYGQGGEITARLERSRNIIFDP